MFRAINHRHKTTMSASNTQSTSQSHQLHPLHPKYKFLVEIYKTAKPAVIPRADYSEAACKICGSTEKEEAMLICDGCDDGFHMTCLRPTVFQVPPEFELWFCESCDHPPTHPGEFSETRRFFNITHSSMKYISPQVPRKRRKGFVWLNLQKKRTTILPYIPSNDVERRKKQMESLHVALKNKNLEFSNELTYFPHGMAPKSANQAVFETDDMQVLSKENTNTVEKCKAMHKRGKCPPLRIVFDTHEGYTVEADGPIKPMTFITEYVGDVDYVKNRANDCCDSLMTLLIHKDASDGLLICPDKRANIARFISGINNQSKEGNKKANLKSLRYNVNGECRVFLVAIRHIKEGDRLYYNYNGQENAYPTDHFI